MESKRDYQKYPDTYRSREIAMIARWIQAGESGCVIGLAGAGKSNFVGYLCDRSEVIRAYLDDEYRPLAMVLVDLNNLPDDQLATLFRVMLRSLYEARSTFAAHDDALALAMAQLYRKVEDKTDAFLCQSAMREAVFLCQDAGVRLVLVMDGFDRFCQEAPKTMLDNLRGLRDTFKRTLSYLVGVRHPLAYLRSPTEMDELYEILDIQQCWLSMMEPHDARWVISQVEAGIAEPFREGEVDQLMHLCGGHPALLKASSLWWATQRENTDVDSWQTQLMAQRGIHNRLDELWQGLTGEEEEVLTALQLTLALQSTKERAKNIEQLEEKHMAALEGLQKKRLAIQTDEGWQIFSPLFEAFVAQVERSAVGKIWRLDPGVNRFFRGDRELEDLSPQDFKMLHYFFDNLEKQPLSIDDMIGGVWTDTQDSSAISNWTVQQALHHLKLSIEPVPSRPRYLKNIRGVGYRFYPEGAPRD